MCEGREDVEGGVLGLDCGPRFLEIDQPWLESISLYASYNDSNFSMSACE